MTATATSKAEELGETQPPMTHRQIMEALSGLLLGMFVAILSSTIVSNALPTIIHDLNGSQTSYTWVVTATLLAMTASTPLWGKLADLASKKVLVQTALVIYVLGSAAAGLSENTSMLIGARAVQGIGVGGLSALAQVIMAAMISPRERGRYSGYLGAVFALGTIGGPLIGGVIVDTDWLGWRWCFYVGVPFAVLALIVLQKTLHLPVVKRRVKVDWAGATLITASVSLLLIWVSLAGDQFPWSSWQTWSMTGGAVLLGLLFVLVETRASEPVIPLRLFRNRTVTLATVASLMVGVTMFGSTVFLSQYFQLAKDESPTRAGLMTMPMILGLFLSSTVSGQIITRTGRWKVFLVVGGVFLTAGFGLLGLLRTDTDYTVVAAWMFLAGIGLGMTMQNLVLSVQNQVAPHELGAASSVVAFFRSLGGAIGVSALGAVLSTKVQDYIAEGLREARVEAPAGSGGGIPDLDKLPEPLRRVVMDSYGHGMGDVFMYAAPFALLALIAMLFIKEVPLRGSKRAGEAGEPAAETEPATAAAPALEVTAETVPAQVNGGRHAGAHRDRLVSVAASPAGRHSGRPSAAASPATDTVTGTATGTATASAGGGPAATRRVHGTVSGAEGTPLSRATLTLIDLSGRQLGRAVTAEDGAYSLATTATGAVVLIAAADGHQPHAATVVLADGSIEHDLVLTGTAGLAGTVRSAADGSPVAGATTVVTDMRGEVLAASRTGEDGAYRFEELVAGQFTLAVSAAAFRPAALPVQVSGTGVTRADVELRPAASLRGTVRVKASSEPLADARVTLVDAAGNVLAVTATGPDGAYAFTDLEAGEYTVIASGYPPVATALTVQGEGVEAFDLDLGHD
ncbi:MFS transporter [Streptomyces capparidis]